MGSDYFQQRTTLDDSTLDSAKLNDNPIEMEGVTPTVSVVSMPPDPPSTPPLTQAGRPMRNYRRPRRFDDVPPDPPASIEPPPPIPNVVRRVILHVRDSFRTGVNQFGILREYLHRPSYDPDSSVKVQDLANFTTTASSSTLLDSPIRPPTHHFKPPWPFDNMSKFLLMNWHINGSSQKTECELDRLAKDVIGHPDFNAKDLVGFNSHREHKQLDSARETATIDTPFHDDSWRELDIELDIPVPKKDAPPRKFSVPGLHYRSIVKVIKATWGAPSSLPFHFTPFRRIHIDPNTGNETRIFDEVYSSEAFETAHNHLQKQTPEPGCNLERVIAGLMFWSDSTHLANFGTAKAWPLYMYFANLSKYARAKPNSGACHHMAYIPSVSCFNPPHCQFSLTCVNRSLTVLMTCYQLSFLRPSKPPTSSLIVGKSLCMKYGMYCWTTSSWRPTNMGLFSNVPTVSYVASIHAYSLIQLITPRSKQSLYKLTTSVTSLTCPCRMLLAALRDKGLCLCPRCLVPRDALDKLGQVRDSQGRTSRARIFDLDWITRARNVIYRLGFPVRSAAIERMLKPTSLAPTVVSLVPTRACDSYT
jgi:Plavaka transposase